jgi:DHA1 family bicyclomycin/chloramphenicol resistance-like MFS transporter
MTSPTKTGVSKLHLTLLVSLLSMIGPFTFDTYLPSFPDIEQDFGVSRALMTQTLGAYLIAFAISTLIWGAITDWVGRKPVILIALGSYCLASIACAFSANFEQLLAFRILQGLGIGGALIAGRAMVRDQLETKEAQKVMARAMILFAIAPAIAPIIGGWLHDAFGWRSVFWFLAIYSSSVFLFSLLKSRESLEENRRNSIRIHKVIRVYLSTLKNPHYLRLVFTLALAFSSFFLYVAGAPTLLFNVLHLAPSQFYLLFIPVVSGIMIGAFISSRLINHFSNRKMINVFLGLMLLNALINLAVSYLFPGSLSSLLLPLVFYSTSLAIIMPIFSILIIDCFPNNRGSASAMQSFIQMGFNGFSVSVIVAMLGAHPENFAIAQLALVGLAFLLWLIDRLTV